MGNRLKLNIAAGEISLNLVNTIKQMIKDFDQFKFMELIHIANIPDHFLRAKVFMQHTDACMALL